MPHSWTDPPAIAAGDTVGLAAHLNTFGTDIWYDRERVDWPYTNTSGSDVLAGQLMVLDPGADAAVTLPAGTTGEAGPFYIPLVPIANGASGFCARSGVVQLAYISVDPSPGDRLQASNIAGFCWIGTSNSFATALYASTTGYVYALLDAPAGILGAQQWVRGANVASAGTITPAAAATVIPITGTTAIATINGGYRNRVLALEFASSGCTVTTAGNVALSGTYTSVAGTSLLLVYDGSAWHPMGGGLANPMTTQDDLIVGGSSGAATRLAKGSDSQVLTVDPSTHHLVWATPSAGFTNPMTTTGDLIKGGSSGAAARLAIGSTGDVLTVSGGAPVWAAPAGGGGGVSTAPWDPYGNAVAPVATAFSVHNHWSGSGIITRLDQNTGNMVFYSPATVSFLEAGSFVPTSVPSPPYTVRACFVPNLVEMNYVQVSLVLRQSSNDKRILLRLYHDSPLKLGDLYLDDYQTLTSGTGTPSGDVGWTQGFPIWLQFRDTGSNLYYEYSKDGQNYVIYQTKASGLFCTPDQAGFTINSGGAASGSAYALTVLSFEVF